MDKTNLRTYIRKIFPNIQLKHPLFYHAPAGIRFELGNQKKVWEKEYMKNVYERAYAIFSSLHDKNDDLLLCFKGKHNTHKRDEEPKIKKYIKTKFSKQEIHLVSESERNEFFIYCKTDDLKHKLLIQSIANRDLHIQPSLEEECYIINMNKHTVFHLYDDRGLDVVSNNPLALKRLQQQFHHWIVDIDEQQLYEQKRVSR
ncbi:DUF3885 domain-containing protein [Metabacillus iocasae]|uniref:DUF3885 domain-containing protein n=1 Tax=Priestia iocasae TaxID=2291674 RepID=A0ABS2QV30_9BACI|nr:DUF3885 domain-containing protein [Metabacillus iocasae]MBM7703133.1 hypothetical protein [Metabacillus iocasae]